MPSGLVAFAAPLGRILLSMIFLMSAANKLSHWQDIVTMLADQKGLPAAPALLAIAVVLELVGGLMVLLGLNARLGAVLLLVFLIPVTFIMHNFWAIEGPSQEAEMVHFMKNVALMGGVLMVLSLGAGPFSIDHARQSQRPPAS